MSTIQHKLHLNLRQRAALRSAISFWERKEVKDRAAEFFKTCEEYETDEVRSKWLEFTKTLVDEWNKDVLPQMLEEELIHIIKIIGKTIFNWYQYIRYEYKVTIDLKSFIDKIKWTPYGTIDEVQIFKSSWLDNPHVDITEVYKFACRFAIEDCINDLWNKIPKNMQVDCCKDIYKSSDQHILAYWKHLRDNDLPDSMRHFQVAANNFNTKDMQVFNLIYDFSFSIKKNMLRLSVYEGYFNATKYFWEKLTEEERDESVLKCARIAVMRYYSFRNQDTRSQDYKRSQCVEICLFLMNQMTVDHKKTFFNDKLGLNVFYLSHNTDVKDDMLGMLLSVWPWQELFIPVLKDMIQYQDDDSQMDCMFFDEITNKMVENHKLGYSLETDKYRCLMREAWFIIPAFIKQKIKRRYSPETFINNLIDGWDLNSLGLILNDPEITAVKDKFISFGYYSYFALIEENQFEKIDQLLEEISRSEKEKKWFKQKMDILYDIWDKDDLDLFDDLLNLETSTLEEKQFTKNIINHFDFCKRLIEADDHKLADKFLDWRFDTEEEKRVCKNHFKSDVFSIGNLCKIWAKSKKDINSAKDKCFQFLHWVFESEEEIALFKKGIIANLNTDESKYDLMCLKSDGMMDDFLYWCLSNNEEFQKIQRIKQSVA